MSCSNCGRQNPPSALYCLDCGQKLRDPGAPPKTSSQPSLAAQPAPIAQPAPVAQPAYAPPAPAPMQPPVAALSAAPGGPATVPCPRCHVDNPTGMRFCRMCGGLMSGEAPPATAAAPQPTVLCPRCRSSMDRGAAFCGVCGLPAVEAGGAAAPSNRAAAPAPAPPRVVVDPALVAPPPAVAQQAPPRAASGPDPAALAAPQGASAVQSVASAPRQELRTDNFGAEVASSATQARLVTILKDGSEGPAYRLTGVTTDVGRSEGNILLPDDPYLSPRHARITLRSGRYYLRDLGSVNGIFYRLREPVVLHHNDVVLVGQQVLRIEMLTDGETSLGPVMHYGVMIFGTPELPRLARLVQLTTEGVPRDVYHLHRDETVVGRESGDIVFTDDAFLSRRHAMFKIDRAQRRVSVRDMSSSNGTLVQFRGEREIVDGDLFRIGHHLFRFDTGGRAGGANGGSSGR